MVYHTTLSSKLQSWWRIHVVLSKPLVFSWVFIAAYSFVEYGVTSIITDYIADVLDKDTRKAAILSNSLDVLLSSLCLVPHYSQSYVGLFNVITFYAGLHVTGLMFLTVFDSRRPDLYIYTKLDSYMLLSLGFVLLIMGKSVVTSAIEDFLQLHLDQKVEREEENESRVGEVRFGIWFHSAWTVGSVMTAFYPADTDWTLTFQISALLMGAGYLVFYSGCVFYTLEKPKLHQHQHQPKEIEIILKAKVFFRVYKAAFRKRKLDYPVSVDGYHWNTHTQSNWGDSNGGYIRLLPKEFGWLDKAAIVSDGDDEKEMCSVKQVKEVKRVSSAFALFLTLLPYGLIHPTATGLFCQQVSDTDSKGRVRISPSALYVLPLVLCSVVRWMFWWRRRLQQQRMTLRVRIPCGMVCLVLCFVAAWRVELRRLSTIGSMNRAWLIPQFLLMGLAIGLVEEGLHVFFHHHVPPSMHCISEPLTELLLAMARILALLLTLIFSKFGLLTMSLNKSRLDLYFLVLAILNFVFLFIYGFFCTNQSFTEPYPQDDP